MLSYYFAYLLVGNLFSTPGTVLSLFSGMFGLSSAVFKVFEVYHIQINSHLLANKCKGKSFHFGLLIYGIPFCSFSRISNRILYLAQYSILFNR